MLHLDLAFINQNNGFGFAAAAAAAAGMDQDAKSKDRATGVYGGTASVPIALTPVMLQDQTPQGEPSACCLL